MGRIIGIPAEKMQIRLLTFPQQVVLRDGSDWISVSDLQRYLEVLSRYVPTVRGQLVYIAGGFLLETMFTVLAVIILQVAGFSLFAAVIVVLSLVFYLVYLLALDLPNARRKSVPWGDSTLMFSLAPVFAICWSVGMVAVRTWVAVSLLWL